jgi:hypothetical protein
MTDVLTRVSGGLPRDKFFRIFLRDRMAMMSFFVELARRTLKNNSEGELGEFLKTLVRKLESERETLHLVGRRSGVSFGAIGEAGGWFAEKLGRLKPNGRLVTYSPLSRVEELEGLLLHAQEREAFWRIVEHKAKVDARLAGFAADAHVESAEEDRRLLERYLLEAADAAI